MNQPTDQPATDQTLADLIDEAIGAKQVLLPYARCQELDEALRAAIAAILPAVQQELGGLKKYSRDWYQVTHVLADTDEVLAEGLGSGLLSAAIQVGRLAEQCRFLAAEVR
ncbi:DUF6415 family natural product biosynthesis protein [Streptomyces sp. NPDC050564]|uniref:DUF6415 family natural product biosynthesis protein n=1 Tax=Streptomyces sp. NPDC050564 TaxID=3365631 RepID=UPI0037A63ED7